MEHTHRQDGQALKKSLERVLQLQAKDTTTLKRFTTTTFNASLPVEEAYLKMKQSALNRYDYYNTQLRRAKARKAKLLGDKQLKTVEYAAADSENEKQAIKRELIDIADKFRKTIDSIPKYETALQQAMRGIFAVDEKIKARIACNEELIELAQEELADIDALFIDEVEDVEDVEVDEVQ